MTQGLILCIVAAGSAFCLVEIFKRMDRDKEEQDSQVTQEDAQK